MAALNTLALKAIELNGRQLWNAYTECVIYEDMFRNSISGHIDIKESEYMHESLPIIGEEFFVIQFASVQRVSGSEDSVLTFMLKTTKITDFTDAGEGQKTYRLHFQSVMAEANRNKRVRKHYEGTGTSIASTIMQEMFGEEFQSMDASKHTESYWFPNWNPFKCIDHLTKCSVSAQYNDPYYIFYEDRDGYHLTTFSKLFDKPKKETIKIRYVTSMLDENQDDYLATRIAFKPMIDVLENELNGMYGGKLVTYDKYNKKVEEKNFTYTGTHGQFKHLSDEKLVKMKAESPKNNVQLLPTNEKDYRSSFTNVKEWAVQSRIRSAQVRGMRAHFWLNRATDLKLGDIIEWDFRNTSTESPHKILSGNWMITRMKHVIQPGHYMCQVETVKDGLG